MTSYSSIISLLTKVGLYGIILPMLVLVLVGTLVRWYEESGLKKRLTSADSIAAGWDDEDHGWSFALSPPSALNTQKKSAMIDVKESKTNGLPSDGNAMHDKTANSVLYEENNDSDTGQDQHTTDSVSINNIEKGIPKRQMTVSLATSFGTPTMRQTSTGYIRDGRSMMAGAKKSWIDRPKLSSFGDRSSDIDADSEDGKERSARLSVGKALVDDDSDSMSGNEINLRFKSKSRTPARLRETQENSEADSPTPGDGEIKMIPASQIAASSGRLGISLTDLMWTICMITLMIFITFELFYLSNRCFRAPESGNATGLDEPASCPPAAEFALALPQQTHDSVAQVKSKRRDVCEVFLFVPAFETAGKYVASVSCQSTSFALHLGLIVFDIKDSLLEYIAILRDYVEAPMAYFTRPNSNSGTDGESSHPSDGPGLMERMLVQLSVGTTVVMDMFQFGYAFAMSIKWEVHALFIIFIALAIKLLGDSRKSLKFVDATASIISSDPESKRRGALSPDASPMSTIDEALKQHLVYREIWEVKSQMKSTENSLVSEDDLDYRSHMSFQPPTVGVRSISPSDDGVISKISESPKSKMTDNRSVPRPPKARLPTPTQLEPASSETKRVLKTRMSSDASAGFDERASDTASALSEDKRRKRKQAGPVYVRAVRSYIPDGSDVVSDLSFKKNAKIEVITKYKDGWMKGSLDGRIGMFPSAFVKNL